ncbi:MASE1 domain-containing protein [Psychrosphaera haliotis]|uniref:MASE1 domain-containing protein n=1 Tax=Psychrosphaera haliotis TaxID=555083 RepID=UPI0012DAD7B1|nr:MASE1 domain-containing protein [Psychrosphaera haliotis]
MILPNNKVFVVLFAFFSYYFIAKVGLLFAIPPGFASTIWPAAGIGLATYLIMGRWALFGIFIASIFANYQVSNSLGNPFFLEMLILPTLLAFGTALQLIVSKRLLIRFFEIPIKAVSLKV